MPNKGHYSGHGVGEGWMKRGRKEKLCLGRSGEDILRNALEKSYNERVFDEQKPREGKVAWQVLEAMEVLGISERGWGFQCGRLKATCILGPPGAAEDQT